VRASCLLKKKACLELLRESIQADLSYTKKCYIMAFVPICKEYRCINQTNLVMIWLISIQLMTGDNTHQRLQTFRDQNDLVANI
jgi:hypothetical protein